MKNARGHVLYEIGEPALLAPSLVEMLPFNRLSVRQKERFENVPRDSALPDVGSRMAQRLIIAGTAEAKVGGWMDVQNGVYRYSEIARDTLNKFWVIWHSKAGRPESGRG